jgi:acetoin utilization protein AcuB
LGEEMLVKEYMTKNPIVLKPKEDVKNAFNLFLEKGIRQAPVVDKGELVGIVSDRDLRMALVQDLKMNNLTVDIIMTKDPVTITEDSKVTDAGKLISKGKFNAIPVIEVSGELTGIISTTDILKCFLEVMADDYLPLITK